MNNKELFETYINPELEFIKHVCWKYWDKTSELEDLHSEVLTNIFRYINTYDSSKPIRPWLYTIIGHDMLRLQKRKWRSIIDYVDLEQHPFTHIPIEDSKYISEDIYTAIESLSPLHYEIVTLRLKGYKMKEIATILYDQGLVQKDSIDIVKWRIREAYS